jgi:hypothetical protein
MNVWRNGLPGRSAKTSFDSNIVGGRGIAGIDREDTLRGLEATSLTLTFRGDRYDLRTVEAALHRDNR